MTISGISQVLSINSHWNPIKSLHISSMSVEQMTKGHMMSSSTAGERQKISRISMKKKPKIQIPIIPLTSAQVYIPIFKENVMVMAGNLLVLNVGNFREWSQSSLVIIISFPQYPLVNYGKIRHAINGQIHYKSTGPWLQVRKLFDITRGYVTIPIISLNRYC